MSEWARCKAAQRDFRRVPTIQNRPRRRGRVARRRRGTPDWSRWQESRFEGQTHPLYASSLRDRRRWASKGDVGDDLALAAYARAAAVAAAHQVCDLALDPRAGGGVVSFPCGVCLAGDERQRVFFSGANVDGPSALGGGARLGQRAVGARRTSRRTSRPETTAIPLRHSHPRMLK
jgi:hypothetical protein